MGRIVSNGIDFEARVGIARVYGGEQEFPIRIEVEDAASGTRVMEVHLSLADFAAAITGLSGCIGKGHVWNGPVGYKSEHKIVSIPVTNLYVKPEDRKLAGAEFLAPYEIDGWFGSGDDLFNHHKRSGNSANVNFHRFVHPVTGEPWFGKEKDDAKG